MKKNIVSVEEFRNYTGYMEEDPSNLLPSYIDAASEVVTDYLGYNPVLQEYDDWISGTGDYNLYLRAQPIEMVSYVSIVNEECPYICFESKDNCIFDPTRNIKFPNGVGNIKVIYTAGYRNVPSIIKIAVMRIAALMLAESNGNIGLTGKAFGDQSRTFINYNNYDKYLRPLSKYRIINFGV